MQKSVNFLELIGGGKIPEVLIGTWIVMGILLVFGFVARASIASAADPVIPDEGISIRSISEMIVEWLDGFVSEVTEMHGSRAMVPFFGCIFMFILFANFFGLIPGMEPPTGDSDLTFALGVICFGYYIYQGFASNGVWYLKSFLGPYLPLAVLMLPIEFADNLFRPFFAGHSSLRQHVRRPYRAQHFHRPDAADHTARILCARIDRLHNPGDHLRGSFDELRATRRKPRSLKRFQ